MCTTGIDTQNKPYFETNAEIGNYCISKSKHALTNYSYQRADERQYCSVALDYYECVECDTLVWRNTGFSQKFIVANITGFEFKNPNVTWVYFEIDPYCTFCGDIKWSNSICLVEREHVENDWNGTLPNWDNIGIAENFSCTPVEATYEGVRKYYTDFNYVVTSPYDANGNPNFSSQWAVNGVYSGMNMEVMQVESQVADYLTTIAENEKADINNVVSVESVPSDWVNYNTQTFYVNMPWYAGNLIGMNNAKCYSSQFCIVRVETYNGNHIDYQPELMDDTSLAEFELFPRIGAGVVSAAIVPIYYAGLAGPFEKALYIDECPQGQWVGNAYAQWLGNNGLATWAGGVMQASTPILSIGNQSARAQQANSPNVFNFIKAGMEVTNSFIQTDAVIKNQMTNGTAVGGSVTNATSAALQRRYGFRIVPYGPTKVQLKAVDAYFDRFGYAVGQLKVPNRNNRPYWNYVKCSEAHVDGDIPTVYRMQIESMLNNGVTFWNNGRTIGDFSNPAGNKG